MIESKHPSKAQKVGEEGQNVRVELERELRRLQSLIGLNSSLKVDWVPNGSRDVHGEVRGDIIYVYDESLEEAVQTLRHEFIDYAVSRTIEPYRDIANKLIVFINEKAYRDKEKLVGALCTLISQEV